MKKRYIVSACLLGENCTYKGDNNYNERVCFLHKIGVVVPVCPEVFGALPTPRCPCEIKDGKVISKEGEDKTSFFNDGAKITLDIGLREDLHKAILKSNSPSCGRDKIYDGSFSSKLIDGQGVTAKLLNDNLFDIFDEKQLPMYDAVVVAAGKGTRTGLPYNKVFEACQNVMCIEASIEPFLADYLCGRVIVVTSKNDLDIMKSLVENEKVIVVEGKDNREASVLEGLKHTTCEYVLIHDGARPYLHDELKDEILYNLFVGNDAVVPYLYAKEKEGNDLFINGIGLIQTPQGYNRDKIVKMMEDIEDLSKYKDESTIYSEFDNVKFIEGDNDNVKITTLEDIEVWRKHRHEDGF